MTAKVKRIMVAGGVASLAALSYAGWANRRLFTVNDVTTGESAAYPSLRSRVYYADPEEVASAAEQSIRGLTRWRVVHNDPENFAIDAEVETAIGGFLDDVTVYVIPLDNGQCRVTIRSRSRQGKGDLGQNVTHIRELQLAMDRRLLRDAAF